MCSRCRLVWNIDDKSVEEVLRAVARMGRIYVILAVLSLFSIYTAIKDDDLFEILYECGILVLFVAYAYVLKVVTEGVPPPADPSPPLSSELNHPARIPKLKAALGIVSLISVAYTLKMVYYGLEDFSYMNLVLSLISVLIQFSTLYVLNKLIMKINFAEGLLSAEDSSI